MSKVFTNNLLEQFKHLQYLENISKLDPTTSSPEIIEGLKQSLGSGYAYKTKEAALAQFEKCNSLVRCLPIATKFGRLDMYVITIDGIRTSPELDSFLYNKPEIVRACGYLLKDELIKVPSMTFFSPMATDLITNKIEPRIAYFISFAHSKLLQLVKARMNPGAIRKLNTTSGIHLPVNWLYVKNILCYENDYKYYSPF